MNHSRCQTLYRTTPPAFPVLKTDFHFVIISLVADILPPWVSNCFEKRHPVYVTQMGRAAPLMQNRDLCRAFVKTGSLGRDIPLGKGLTGVWGFQKKMCQVFPTGPLVLQRPDKGGWGGECPGCCAFQCNALYVPFSSSEQLSQL